VSAERTVLDEFRAKYNTWVQHQVIMIKSLDVVQ